MTEYKTLKSFQERFSETYKNPNITAHCNLMITGSVSEAERKGDIEPTSERRYIENAKKQSKKFVEIIKKILEE